MLSARKFESIMDAVWNWYARAMNTRDRELASILGALWERLNDAHARRYPSRHRA